jgi:ATP-binding cassette, subfamily C, bacterial
MVETKNSLVKKLYPSIYFIKANPSKSLVIIFLLLLSGIAEAFSFASLLPLINVAVEGKINTDSKIGEWIYNMFAFLEIDVSLGSILSIIVLLMVFKSLLLFFALKKTGYASAEVAASLRKRLLEGLIHADWQFFVHQKKGDITAAIGSEPDRAAAIFILTGRLLASIIQIIVYSALSFSLSKEVTLASYILGLFIMFLLRGFIKMARGAGEMQTSAHRTFLSNLVDGLTGLKPLKSMARINILRDYLADDIDLLCKARKKGMLSKVALNNIMEPLQIIPIALGLYFLMSFWKQDLDSLLVLILLFYRTLQRIGITQKQYQDINTANPAFWFLDEILEKTRTQAENWTGISEPTLKEGIVLHNVYFSYENKAVLSGINLKIKQGEFVALIGNSGSGKSTIADLIIGFHRVALGKIMIDGRNLDDIDVEKWREKIGYVPQETFLFNDTIKQNITMGDESITDEKILSALKRSGAYDFVSQLPEKIMTVTGEHGAKLSGGQSQRLAIARALIKKTELLILDEATTALDPKTEAEIMKTLIELKGNMTIIAISHQTAIQTAADKIYSLKGGQVVELERKVLEEMN